MTVIFLAGVHGVGKGHLGALVSTGLGMRHLTASQLIREEKGRESWGKDKVVTDVDDNQRALIQAVERLRDSGQALLLDGHFVLRAPNGDFIRLQAGVFSALKLSGVVLLCEDADRIAARLLQRDGVHTTPDSIRALAAEEEAHARKVCGALNIPLAVFASPTEISLTDAIRRLVSK
ncbi:ATP-binding protein [Janthinobacterium sp. GB4P2]|uniref:ATP-binding protein n=1 Tax=Janthinobacterium sp. GB4P2 TaxID=3424189 RepID=UPI003F291E5D